MANNGASLTRRHVHFGLPATALAIAVLWLCAGCGSSDKGSEMTATPKDDATKQTDVRPSPTKSPKGRQEQARVDKGDAKHRPDSPAHPQAVHKIKERPAQAEQSDPDQTDGSRENVQAGKAIDQSHPREVQNESTPPESTPPSESGEADQPSG
jgi:hypothetical protein